METFTKNSYREMAGSRRAPQIGRSNPLAQEVPRLEMNTFVKECMQKLHVSEE